MKKVTVFIDDEVQSEIKRQAKSEERSFAAFLRRFLKNHFAVSGPPLTGPNLSVYPPGLTVTQDQWHAMTEEQKADFNQKKTAWDAEHFGAPSDPTTGGPIVVVPGSPSVSTPPEYRAPTPQNPLS